MNTGSLVAAALVAAFAAPALAEDPALAAHQAGVQDYDPAPAVWLLQDNDTRIYLFGTIHVLPEDFRWRSAQLDAIIADADELVVEATGEELDDGEELMAGVIETMAARPPLTKRLTPAARAKWLAFGALLGVPAEAMNRMPPQLMLFGLLGGGGEVDSAEIANGVESVLEQAFEDQSKPVGSIESAAGVLQSLLAIDDASLIADLEAVLGRWDGKSLASLVALGAGKAPAEAAPLAIEHAWARGDVVALEDDAFGRGKFGRTVGQLLLETRNRAWAEWLDQRLDTPGTVLVAVGAAHFGGERSVRALLAERGLEATRLD